ncbi:MAG TPA: hypothetical protein VL997_05235 [Dyella sp.]|nr:hypothetical protein [Dyella sp.]
MYGIDAGAAKFIRSVEEMPRIAVAGIPRDVAVIETHVADLLALNFSWPILRPLSKTVIRVLFEGAASVAALSVPGTKYNTSTSRALALRIVLVRG